jgi:predicted ATPase/class 3 adenylate cyclase
MEFNVLGPVSVSMGFELLSVGGLKQRTVLALLVSRGGVPLTADAIATAVYGDDVPERARRSVQTYVSTLRSVLGDVIFKKGNAWTLHVDRAAVDASRFEDLYASTQGLSSEAASEVLREALSLWRGDPYADVEAHGELDAEISRLVELRLSVLAARIDADLRSGRTGDLIGEIEALVVEHPYQEQFRGQHMLALYRGGRQSEALRSFQELRTLLVDELGVDPSSALQTLEQRILEQDESLLVGIDPLIHKPAPADGRADQIDSTGVSPGQSLPSGVVTFLFTDVEDSTRLWADDHDEMAASLRLYDEVLRGVIEAHSGYVFATAGDAFRVAFDRASDAVSCASTAQVALAEAEWSGPVLGVRMGLHLGEAEERHGDYLGPVVNTAARVAAASHGGQVLVSDAVLSTVGVEANDLGVHRLRDVADLVHLFQIGDGEFPPLRVVPDTLSTLPIPPTPLLGREDEILRVRTMLLEHRLVTVTGVGGSGKTRLAIEIAEQELPTLAHGAYFADLARVSDDDGVVAAVVEAVRLRLGGGGDALGQLLDHLVDKQALVVLDNCEHVIDACAEFAEAALAHPGDWRLLATSREHLDVAGERVVQVPSLSSDGEGAAVRLFVERATAANPGFVVDDANRGVIAELCGRLDGMPLAIELAAARTVVMSPSDMLERIDDRFRVLSEGQKRTRERRRTLEATLDWSYDLLDDDEQRLLRTVGVFVGPFDASAAAAVGRLAEEDAVDVLESLVAKSLVVATTVRGTVQFRLLETVRAYAQELLQRNSELETVRHTHLEYHLAAMAATNTEELSKYGQGSAWDWSAVQRWMPFTANLEAAIDWAIATDRHPDAGEILADASQLWREQAAQPNLDRIDAVIAAIPEDSGLRDHLRITEMEMAYVADDVPRLLSVAAEAALSLDDAVRNAGLHNLANVLTISDPAESRRMIDLVRQSGVDPFGLANKNVADLHIFAGEYEQALALLRPYEGMNVWVVLDAAIAAALLMSDRPAQALEIVKDHAMSDSIWMSYGVIIGLCHLALGDRDAAQTALVDEARTAVLGRMKRSSNSALVGLAALVNHDGATEWATKIILQASQPRESAVRALGRMVAEQIGVRDDYVQVQELLNPDPASTEGTAFLKETLTRWDAQQAAM